MMGTVLGYEELLLQSQDVNRNIISMVSTEYILYSGMGIIWKIPLYYSINYHLDGNPK